MKVLVINGDCIQTNSSANLCHLSYIQGLIDNDVDVTLISACGAEYKTDPAIVVPNQVVQVTFNGVSFYQKVSARKSQVITENTQAYDGNAADKEGFLHKSVRRMKRVALSLYGPHGIYATFVKRADKFKSDEKFDYVISLSTPPSSHLLAYRLLKSKQVRAAHWIQIWEDPWYSDAYGFNGKEKIRKEEKRLLSFAEKVCYVSPLTLENQKRLFPESAEKMFWMPLPSYYKNDEGEQKYFQKNVYGYFGDYAPAARNLAPFYSAAKETGVEVNICGNPCNLFCATEQIHIHPRLPLAELKPIEDCTNVLVFLCNRKGGQIPGKIYQYSATNKTILFILDGTEEEQTVLKAFFGKFNRYVFCQNTTDDIARAIRQIEAGALGVTRNAALDDFEPKKIVECILEAGR